MMNSVLVFSYFFYIFRTLFLQNSDLLVFVAFIVMPPPIHLHSVLTAHRLRTHNGAQGDTAVRFQTPSLGVVFVHVQNDDVLADSQRLHRFDLIIPNKITLVHAIILMFIIKIISKFKCLTKTILEIFYFGQKMRFLRKSNP